MNEIKKVGIIFPDVITGGKKAGARGGNLIQGERARLRGSEVSSIFLIRYTSPSVIHNSIAGVACACTTVFLFLPL